MDNPSGLPPLPLQCPHLFLPAQLPPAHLPEPTSVLCDLPPTPLPSCLYPHPLSSPHSALLPLITGTSDNKL